jgi:hypothetical protein
VTRRRKKTAAVVAWRFFLKGAAISGFIFVPGIVTLLGRNEPLSNIGLVLLIFLGLFLALSTFLGTLFFIEQVSKSNQDLTFNEALERSGISKLSFVLDPDDNCWKGHYLKYPIALKYSFDESLKGHIDVNIFCKRGVGNLGTSTRPLWLPKPKFTQKDEVTVNFKILYGFSSKTPGLKRIEERLQDFIDTLVSENYIPLNEMEDKTLLKKNN